MRTLKYRLNRVNPQGVEQRPIVSRDYHRLWCMAWLWEERGPEWKASITDCSKVVDAQ